MAASLASELAAELSILFLRFSYMQAYYVLRRLEGQLSILFLRFRRKDDDNRAYRHQLSILFLRFLVRHFNVTVAWSDMDFQSSS